MTRKSAKQRLNEIKTLRQQYQENPNAEAIYSWDVKFLEAMIDRMSKSRALSTNMRKKIDSLVSEGMKSPPECEEADKLEAISEYLNFRESQVLKDFSLKIRKGWKLSERQQRFKDVLVAQAKHIQKNGHWEPSKEEIAKMNLVCKIANSYSDSYWYSHPSSAKAIENLRQYLNPKQPNLKYNITEEDWEHAKYAVRGKLKLLEVPRFTSGQKCLVLTKPKYLFDRTTSEKVYGIICSDPYVNESGEIVYDVLYNGTCEPVSNEKLYKR